MNKKPHIKLAHFYWENILKKGDRAIDATSGNGFDTLFLAKILLDEKQGHIFSLDIQQEAILETKKLLKNNLPSSHLKRIKILQKSHEDLSSFPLESIQLVVYNLGYLPKGDKSITTKTSSTINSLNSLLHSTDFKGAISITCYPGHSEGEKEEKALLNHLSSLSSKEWEICYHKWINREKSPSLIFLKKLHS